MKVRSLAIALACTLVGCFSLAQSIPTVSIPSSSSKAEDPLLKVLVSKNIITKEEAAAVNAAATPEAQRQKLTQLLVAKGVLTKEEASGILGAKSEPVLLASTTPGNVAFPAAPTLPKTTVPAPGASAPQAPPAPSVIPAITPIRLLPVDPIQAKSVMPDVKLGSGASMKFYGFVKATAVYDSSSPSGTDMPLPYLNTDAGPTVAPEFHIKARATRVGSQFEWPDMSPRWAITGRIEADFEGNYSRALNRNISTIRSSMFSIRSAWGRVDYKATDNVTWFALFGQDWTPFASSTIPNLLETTGLGLGFGTLYERAPQFRTGLTENLGGARKNKFLEEFAIVMPAFGNDPTDVGNQLGYGERQGADSERPEVQARFVYQFQLDTAPGVAPAQLIFSGVQGRRTVLVPAGNVPAAFKGAFPSGASVDSERYGVTAELQAPTRYLTVTAKVWAGADLRWYFVGGLYSNFNDAYGYKSTSTVASVDGGSNVVFGTRPDGSLGIAPQLPVRTRGFNADIGLPISRWFGVDPKSRAAGWTANLHYALDTVPGRDARRLAGVRGKDDLAAATIFYKLNNLVTFAFEQSYYRTRAANNSASDFGGLFTLRGIPARNWHDNRTEFGPVFTF
jgi:hypothetical protein